jgi:hypothetical protein
VQAADAGDERAKYRLAAIREAASGGNPMDATMPRNVKTKNGSAVKPECAVM